MNEWTISGHEYYKTAPDGGIIWISPADDRPGFNIVHNKDGHSTQWGYAEDLRDAKDIAERECGKLGPVVKVGYNGCMIETEVSQGVESDRDLLHVFKMAPNGNLVKVVDDE